MGTEIRDGDTREQISRLAEDIPRHAEHLLEAARARLDSAVDLESAKDVEQMEAEFPNLINRLSRRAEQYLEGHARTFDDMIEKADAAWTHIQDVQEVLDSCQNELNDWSEAPISEINVEYIGRLQTASELQRSWLEEMGRALSGYRDLLAETRHRAFLVFEAVDYALQYKGVPGSGGHLSWADFGLLLGIVASVITLNPIPMTAGSAFKTVQSLVSVGNGLSSLAKTSNGKHVELEGRGSLSNPIPSLVDALDRLTDLGQKVHDSEEGTFMEGFHQDTNEVNTRGGLHINPWDVAQRDSTPALPPGDVAVNIARLYRVGVEMLPAAAYGYQQAAGELESLQNLEGTAFGWELSGYDTVIGYSRQKYEEFRQAILDCCEQTRDDLLDVSSRIEQIAQNHRTANEIGTEIMDRMNQYVNDFDDSFTTVSEAAETQGPRHGPNIDEKLGPGAR